MSALFDDRPAVPAAKRYAVGSYVPSGKWTPIFFVYHEQSARRVTDARGALRKFTTREAARKAADALERKQ